MWMWMWVWVCVLLSLRHFDDTKWFLWCKMKINCRFWVPFIKIIGIVSAADRETVCVCEFVCKRCKRQIMRKNGNPMENNLNKQTNTHRHFECHMRSTMFRCTIARRTSRQPAKRNIHLFLFNEILAALVKVNIRKHQVFVRSFVRFLLLLVCLCLSFVVQMRHRHLLHNFH